jgi:alkylated DNA nucleotide flippase Atl1
LGTTASSQHEFALDVLDLVDSIPPGRVLSYGEVAAMLGSRASRRVGAVLRESGGEHPWWRVLRAGGHPPRGHEKEARRRYLAEGTPLVATSTEGGYRVDYAVARWIPTEPPTNSPVSQQKEQQ